MGGGVRAEKASEKNQAAENEDNGVSGLKQSKLKNNIMHTTGWPT